jgi:CubicO group peptidase (beta-lactamase class C family)
MLRRCACTAVVLAVWISIGLRVAGQTASSNGSRMMLEEAATSAAQLPRLHSLLVSWRGELVLERYFNGRRPASLDDIKSASKSTISALIGIAIDRGLIAGVTQPIATFFPDLLGSANDPKRQITIEDLLTMRSGLESTSNRNYGAWVQSGNWVRYALTRPLLTQPATRMQYSTGNSHLLSAILTQVTGKSTWQFAQEALAKPLGFTLAQWPRDPQGIYFGGNEMLMTPRQMLMFGELYLNGGRTKGLQLVPARWIETSFIPRGQSDISEQLYGYGWWIRGLAGHQAYYAWGYGGQFIFLVPDLKLVVVSTSSSSVSDERRSHTRAVEDIIERLIVEPIAAASRSGGLHPGAQDLFGAPGVFSAHAQLHALGHP